MTIAPRLVHTELLMESNPAPLFNPEILLAQANGGRTVATYRRDQIVFSQGEPADAVFYIQQGQVKLTVLSERGKEAVVGIFGTGDFCGEGCLAGQSLRIATAEAIEKSEIMRLEKAAMISLLHNEPEFAERFMVHLLARNVRVEADLVDQLFNSSEKRLARILLILEMVGTTRARVNFFMNKFRKMGLIDYNGHLEIHSSLLDVVLHDEPRVTGNT